MENSCNNTDRKKIKFFGEKNCPNTTFFNLNATWIDRGVTFNILIFKITTVRNSDLQKNSSFQAFKDENVSIFLKTQFVPRSKHSLPRL